MHGSPTYVRLWLVHALNLPFLCRPARAMHIWRWLYDDGQWIRKFSDTVGLQNGFSQAFVEKAEQVATCSGGVQLQNVMTSEDGTRKMLFSIDGLHTEQIETVLIPVVRKQVRTSCSNRTQPTKPPLNGTLTVQGRRKRTTVCVSSQVGCAMGCTFCYTGKCVAQSNRLVSAICSK